MPKSSPSQSTQQGVGRRGRRHGPARGTLRLRGPRFHATTDSMPAWCACLCRICGGWAMAKRRRGATERQRRPPQSMDRTQGSIRWIDWEPGGVVGEGSQRARATADREKKAWPCPRRRDPPPRAVFFPRRRRSIDPFPSVVTDVIKKKWSVRRQLAHVQTPRAFSTQGGPSRWLVRPCGPWQGGAQGHTRLDGFNRGVAEVGGVINLVRGRFVAGPLFLSSRAFKQPFL